MLGYVPNTNPEPNPNPKLSATDEAACSGLTGHTEGVKVVYDPAKISFVDILRWFWEAHDPCSGMGQGNDRGTQYRSGFYYFDEEQKALIEASKVAYEKALADAGKGRPITTEIAAASDYDQYGGLWYACTGHTRSLLRTLRTLRTLFLCTHHRQTLPALRHPPKCLLPHWPAAPVSVGSTGRATTSST